MAALEKDKAALTEETRRLKVDLKKAQEVGQTREAQNQDSCEHPTNDKVNLFLNKQSLLRQWVLSRPGLLSGPLT